MLFRIAEQLRHAPQPQTLVGLFSFRRAAFSFCSATLLAYTRPTDEMSTPQQSQNPHEPDEARLKAEKRRKNTEYNRSLLQKKSEDPVWLEQYRNRQKESFHRFLRKKSKDEAWKYKRLDDSNEKKRLRIQKIYDNDASKQQYMAAQRIERAQRYAANYDMRRRYSIRTWFWRNKDNLDTFAWKRWIPICLPESVDRVCATCRTRSIWGQRRLWFVKNSDPELWDCLSCFCSSDLSDIVPIQGAERFYKGRYLQPESTGGENIDEQADTHEAGAPKQDEVEAHSREHLTVKEERRVEREPKQP